MNLYLDDDIAKGALVGQLVKAGHLAIVPKDAGCAGASDPRHLTHAIRHGLILLSKNYRDYLELHDLVQAASGVRNGVLLVRADNDPTRDMKDRDIVRSLQNLERSSNPKANQVNVLNHWR